jgi:hypothetical protein
MFFHTVCIVAAVKTTVSAAGNRDEHGEISWRIGQSSGLTRKNPEKRFFKKDQGALVRWKSAQRIQEVH